MRCVFGRFVPCFGRAFGLSMRLFIIRGERGRVARRSVRFGSAPERLRRLHLSHKLISSGVMGLNHLRNVGGRRERNCQIWKLKVHNSVLLM